jgi:hypothetical protein
VLAQPLDGARRPFARRVQHEVVDAEVGERRAALGERPRVSSGARRVLSVV